MDSVIVLETLTRAAKLGAFGIVTFLLALGITAFLKEVVGVFYVYSYLVALTTVTVINFTLNINVIFYVEASIVRFTKYIVVLVIVFGVNTVLLKALTEVVGLHYLLSTALVTIGSFFLKFVVYDKWVFAKG